jgi:hypothetical protein
MPTTELQSIVGNNILVYTEIETKVNIHSICGISAGRPYVP